MKFAFDYITRILTVSVSNEELLAISQSTIPGSSPDSLGHRLVRDITARGCELHTNHARIELEKPPCPNCGRPVDGGMFGHSNSAAEGEAKWTILHCGCYHEPRGGEKHTAERDRIDEAPDPDWERDSR